MKYKELEEARTHNLPTAAATRRHLSKRLNMSTAILQALITPNAKQLFAEHCKAIRQVWEELLEKTTLPDNVTSMDSSVLERLRELDNRIKSRENRDASRLAYIQLTRVLAGLRRKIHYDRRNGLLAGKRGQRDATIAIDIYLHATERANRAEVYKLVSLSNRWTAFAGRYPLMLVTYTDIAERIMYVRSLSLAYIPRHNTHIEKPQNSHAETKTRSPRRRDLSRLSH